MNIREAEVLRYLGYKEKDPDQETLKAIRECIQELLQSVTPKSVYGKWTCKIEDKGLFFQDIHFNSLDLKALMESCHEVIVFAATLGVKADEIIRRYSLFDMRKASIMQAALAEMIESYCDDVCSKLEMEARQRDCYLTSRFSPGYGDFPLSSQADIFRVLDCTRKIGLTLTESFIMTPMKSVTALMGVTRHNNTDNGLSPCALHSCSQCNKIDCGFRRL